MTFDPHPAMLLRPEQSPPPLTWTERKAELLVDCGIDWMLAYPTDKKLLGLSARQFFDRILLETLQAKAIVEGPNFYFGNNREGDVGLLQTFAKSAGVDVEIVEPTKHQDSLISSSRIRAAIAQGDVAEANSMLGRPYRLRGLVAHGDGRGATLGFPTANLEGIDTLLPAEGVYAGLAITNDGIKRAAAINVGPNPTFDVKTIRVEVHLICFHETLYGQVLEVDFLKRLRGTKPFDSADKLIEQLKLDVAESLETARRYSS